MTGLPSGAGVNIRVTFSIETGRWTDIVTESSSTSVT